MIRITFLSVLLGAVALVVVVTLFFPPQHSSQQGAPAIIWNVANANAVSGTATRNGDALQIALNSEGTGLVELDTPAFAARDFSFIRLALERSAMDTTVAVVWTKAPGVADTGAYKLESRSWESLWLSTDELSGWDGDIATLGLQFYGRAGDSITIRDFSVFPSTPLRQLRAIYSDLTAYAPWNSAAMNTYTGAFNASSFYPVVLAVALLILSLLAYAIVLLVFRKRTRFNPAVVLLIFFTTWIILDLFWQSRLLHQLADTRRTFSGKSTEEKLVVGPDAELYKFVSHTKPMLQPNDARIFVASSDKYTGMRAAYYFYPLNVYWSLYAPPLPPAKLLRTGDYVVLVSPAPFQFDAERSLITAPGKRKFKAELVFADAIGTVVRLK